MMPATPTALRNRRPQKTRKLGAKMVLVLATATCRQHQLSINFRPTLFGEQAQREPGEG